jgi:bifunctional DNA-binding transcriptional regulator/antitoxin component of YhaV-PrlF toxin-antitoxin module
MAMGYRVKIQKVERPTNRSFYVNFPAPIADAVGMRKGEELEWEIEDLNTFVLRRVKPARSSRKNGKP